MEKYDKVIFIYPIWWWTVPKPVETFVRSVDLTGKDVYLVITHGGSKAGDCPEDMQKMMNGGTLSSNVLTVYDDNVTKAADDVYDWLKSIAN